MSTQRTISIDDDYIDSRDVVERIEELETDQDELDDVEREELAMWQDFAEQGSYAPDWDYGETFIAESYFVDYCQELVNDCGYISDDLPDFIARNIDWEGVADALRVDYFEIVVSGRTFLAR